MSGGVAVPLYKKHPRAQLGTSSRTGAAPLVLASRARVGSLRPVAQKLGVPLLPLRPQSTMGWPRTLKVQARSRTGETGRHDHLHQWDHREAQGVLSTHGDNIRAVVSDWATTFKRVRAGSLQSVPATAMPRQVPSWWPSLHRPVTALTITPTLLEAPECRARAVGPPAPLAACGRCG